MGNFASPGVFFFQSSPQKATKKAIAEVAAAKGAVSMGTLGMGLSWDILLYVYIYIYTYVTYVCVYTLVPKYDWLLWMLHTHMICVYIYIHQMLFIQLELFKG